MTRWSSLGCCLLAVLATVHAVVVHTPRRIAGGSTVSFSSTPAYKFLVTIYVDSALRCPGVAISQDHILTSASCFETGTSTGGVWDGELQEHKEMNAETAGGRVVVTTETNTYDSASGVNPFTLIPDNDKRAVKSVYIHPNYKQMCSTDYDVAVVTLTAGFDNGQQLAQLHGTGPVTDAKAAGWGLKTTVDSGTTRNLVVGTVNITSGDECSSEWPEWDDKWQLCSIPYQGSGPCDLDAGSVMFYMQGSTPIVVGLVSRLGGGSCPKSVASWARVSALKDEICGVAGCANDSNADSSGERGLCRWTALKVHAILFFILCAGFVPASLIIQTGVYELARKPDKSVDVQYLKEYSPTLDYVVLGIEGVGVLGFLIPAIIVVAVGVAPNNGKYAHSIIGYLLLALIIAQIILTLVLRKYGHAKQWKDPSNPKYTVYRVKHFNGFAIYLLLLYIETPIGILRIGYGAGAFFGWFAYLAFLHLLHFIWVKTAQCASLSKKVHPAKEVVDEELEAPPPSQKYRSKSVSPSRRVSLQDHHKPWFVKDDHVQKEERSQKRRETIANQLRRKSQTNLFSQVADAVQRRRSFSEGLSEVFSDRPKLESERLSMARATGGERRASQRVSTYEGPRDTGNTAVQESTQRMGSRRASMRRGSVSNMNY